MNENKTEAAPEELLSGNYNLGKIESQPVYTFRSENTTNGLTDCTTGTEDLNLYQLLTSILSRLNSLEARLNQLESRLNECEARFDAAYEMTQEDIASDRKRITSMERRFESSNRESEVYKNRRELAMALLLSNGGKMLQKDLREKLELDKATMSRFINEMRMEGLIKTKLLTTNKNYRVIYIANG